MRKIYFSAIFATLLCCVLGTVQAQTYDLYDVTEDAFKLGGNTSAGWSFEHYTKSTGLYGAFSLYGDSSYINQYDNYGPYRFGGELKGSADESVVTGLGKFFMGYANHFKSLYLTKPTNLNVETIYMGYKDSKFESLATPTESPAFVFTVPAEGYYKIEYTVQNQDAPTAKFGSYPMIVNRYRYATQSNINYANSGGDMGFNVSYSQGGIQVLTGNTLPDNTIADRTWYTPFAPESHYFYFYGKQGDKVTLEQSQGAGCWWNATRWYALKATTVTSSEATADSRYVNPYAAPDLTALNVLYDEAYDLNQNANAGKEKGQYKAADIASFNGVYEQFLAVYPDGINIMNVKVWEQTLAAAIATLKKQVNEVTWANHYKLFPYDTTDDAEVAQHTSWYTEQSSDLVNSRWKFFSYANATGKYTKIANYASAGKYTATNSWYDSSNEWFYIGLDGALHPLTTKQPAILFTAPVDGYYKVYSGIQRTNASPPDKKMYQRCRFIPSTYDVAAMVVPKESYLIAQPFGSGTTTAARLVEVDTSYYVKLKAGDHLSFELDCYTVNSNSSANSKWTKIAIIDLQKEYSSEAEILTMINADATRTFINPYKVGNFASLSSYIGKGDSLLQVTSGKIGVELGQYPALSKELFTEVLNDSKDIVSENTANQFEIDAQLATLKTAFITYQQSRVNAICTPSGSAVGSLTDAGKLPSGYYYIKSPEGYYLTAPSAFGSTMYYAKKIVGLNADPIMTAQVFNIQYNAAYDTDTYKRYTLVSVLNDANGGTWTDVDGVGHINENGKFLTGNTATAQSTTGNNHTWRNHSIYFDGTSYCFYNIYNLWSNDIKAVLSAEQLTGTSLSQLSGQKDFYYNLVPIANDNENYSGIHDTDIQSSVTVRSIGGQVLISNAEVGDIVEIYDLSGRLIKKVILSDNNQAIGLGSNGLYMVKVVGKNTKVTAKVVIQK